MRKTLSVLAAFGLMFGLAACGDDDLSRDDAVEELMDEGATEEQANCVLDIMDDLDIDYSADEDDVPEDKQDEFFEAVLECAS